MAPLPSRSDAFLDMRVALAGDFTHTASSGLLLPASKLRAAPRRAASAAGAKRPRTDERAFLQRVTTADGFWRAIGGFSRNHDVDEDKLQRFGEEVARCCWSEAGELLTDESGPMDKAKAEIERLQNKLKQCQLSAMKELMAVKAGHHGAGEMGDDAVTFHEPLQYLEPDMRELVLHIVLEKTRMIEYGKAPDSLVKAIERHVDALKAPQPAAADPEELKELQAALAQAKEDLKGTKKRLLEAEERERGWEGRLAAAEAKAAEAQQKVKEALEREAALLKANEELQKAIDKQKEELKKKEAEIEQQKLELERQRLELQEQRLQLMKQQEEIQRQAEEIQRQAAEIEKGKAEVQRLEAEVEKERGANEELRTQVARLQERVREYMRKTEELEKKLAELQAEFEAEVAKHKAQYAELEKETNKLREELARRNNTKTRGTQTELTGEKMAKREDETKRLKVMLEELQMKMKELMDKCRKKVGGHEMSEICEALGLKEMVKEDTVFQRLYDDALERVQRLEKLRDRIRSEKRGGLAAATPLSKIEDSLGETSMPGYPPTGRPSPAVTHVEDTPILEAVENSRLPGLRKFASEAAKMLGQATPYASPAPPPRDPSPPPVAQRRLTWNTPEGGSSLQERGCGDGVAIAHPLFAATPQQRPMKSSASLPALVAHPSVINTAAGPNAEVAFFQLEYGSAGRTAGGASSSAAAGTARRRRLRF
eukprot:TRINITY_DN102012_c0_g1_i1.p1 TRINITY_DN102012_c0_g1~~TRINITY_DN102012_c0_g1_i1.p1  ORF type:complete len:714 (-),score=258.11 TRINITY_DN102012_c0_g1_i1:294-2435(-)